MVVDRAKDVIKSGGKWISSVRLEDLIMTHPAVNEVAVIAARSQKWSERPIALVTLKPGARVSEEEIRGISDEELRRDGQDSEVVAS